MNWIRSTSSFKYDGKPVTREKYLCETPLGNYRVFQAVNGKWFIEYPYMGLDENEKPVIRHGKMPCNSKEEGLIALEGKWKELMNQFIKVNQ